jgi:3-hydroxyisobutyrate dehydrogenase
VAAFARAIRSGVPDVSQRIAKALAATGVEFLDCGVAGGPAGAAAGKLSAMVGGEAAALAAAEPCMAHCMAKIVHVGPAGVPRRPLPSG